MWYNFAIVFTKKGPGIPDIYNIALISNHHNYDRTWSTPIKLIGLEVFLFDQFDKLGLYSMYAIDNGFFGILWEGLMINDILM